LEQLRFYQRDIAKEEPPEEGEQPVGRIGRFIRRVRSLAEMMTASIAERLGVQEAIQTALDKAGLPLRSSEFLFFHLLAVLGAAVAGLILLQHPLAVALSAAAATIAPLLILKRLTGKRERMFYAQLPDTLSHLSGALKAGYSFLQAVDMVVEETLPPMSTELSRVITETRLGLPVETALDNMAARMNCMDFNWTVMAVKIQREVGGNLAEILEVLGGTIRERDRVQRQIKVLTAEGRLSAAILFLLPVVVAVLLFLINPGYLSELYTRIAGIALLTLAAGLMVAGGVWLRKVVRIEV